MSVDHIRDPSTDSLPTTTASLGAGLSGLARSGITQGWRVNVESGNGALGTKLAGLAADVE